MFDSWALAMAAFNCGKNRLKKEIEQQQVSDYYRLNLPQETERYIFRILAAKLIIEKPARYGYDLAPSSLYQPIPIATIDLNLRAPVHMTDFARALDTDFKVIKKLNPQFTGHYLTPGKHTLNVPPGTEARAQAFIAEAAQKAPARTTAGAPDIYIVKPGDTLSHVSLRTGVPIKTLQTLNGLSTTVIFEGQRLRLKPAD
jgi:membrane-bound lytic murein transglycosylase D